MKKVSRRIFAFALITASAEAQVLTARLDALLTDRVQKDGPGVAAMLIRDGKIVYRKGFGLADLDTHKPITPDTQFRLSSMTKQFTAMAVMILQERGKLQF